MADDDATPVDLRIRVYPDSVLRSRAAPVAREVRADDLARLAAAMIRLMHDARGVGLAAPQVGVSLRLVVVEPDPERGGPLVMVNPEIVDSSGRYSDEEACLSLPGVTAGVNRRERLRVEFDSLAGRREAFDAAGLPARIIQHELDHLDGRLFIDRLSPEGRLAVREALRALEEKAAGGG